MRGVSSYDFDLRRWFTTAVPAANQILQVMKQPCSWIFHDVK